jgi:hypothetical protein
MAVDVESKYGILCPRDRLTAMPNRQPVQLEILMVSLWSTGWLLGYRDGVCCIPCSLLDVFCPG